MSMLAGFLLSTIFLEAREQWKHTTVLAGFCSFFARAVGIPSARALDKPANQGLREGRVNVIQ